MTNEDLWKRYKQNSNPDLKKQIIKQYANLVHYVIKKSKFVNLDIIETGDYFQFGVEGLSEAIERYDLDYGTKFETYAIQRIRGKIIDELRKIQIKPRAMVNGDNKPFYTNVSLSQPVDQEEGYFLSETIAVEEESPEDTAERTDEKEILMSAINQLPEKQKLVIVLYYYENLTYKEIAEVLNITVSRVSQIHTQVVKILKDNLKVLSADFM
jgi:RNA polymerase sigma factor for flagellar operon FliA